MEKTISVEKMFKFIEWLHEVNSPKQLNGNNRFKYRPIVLSLSIDPKTDKVVENQLVWKVKDLKGKTTTHSLDDMWEMYLRENVTKTFNVSFLKIQTDGVMVLVRMIYGVKGKTREDIMAGLKKLYPYDDSPLGPLLRFSNAWHLVTIEETG